MLVSLNAQTVNATELDFQSTHFENTPFMSVSKESVQGDFVVSTLTPSFFFNFIHIVDKEATDEKIKEHSLNESEKELKNMFPMGFQILNMETTTQQTNKEQIVSAVIKVKPSLYGSKKMVFTIQQHQFIKVKKIDNEYPVKVLKEPRNSEAFLISSEIDQQLLTDFVLQRVIGQFFKSKNDVVEIHENDLYTRKNPLMDSLHLPSNLIMIESTIKELNINYALKNINVYKA